MTNKQPEPLIRADELEAIGAESSLARTMAAHTIRLLYAENEALRARLAQPEPESMDWMEECADFWNRYRCLNERAQERCEEQAEMWIEKLREKNT